MNTSLKNIHFLATSNHVSVLELLRPIVDELKTLENGVFLYDSHWKQDVFVIAPIFAVICDYPRASKISSHMTGNPKKFCRLCLVSDQCCDCCYIVIFKK